MADYPVTIIDCSGTEENINGRPVFILMWSASKKKDTLLQHQLMSGRCQIQMPFFNGLAIDWNFTMKSCTILKFPGNNLGIGFM